LRWQRDDPTSDRRRFHISMIDNVSGLNSGNPIVMRRSTMEAQTQPIGGSGIGNFHSSIEYGHFRTGQGGEVVLQFAKGSSSTNNTILRAGSIVYYRRIE
jgi:hypothetical protein